MLQRASDPIPRRSQDRLELGGIVKLYRAVCQAEADDLIHTGEFRTVPHSVEGKWFAETEADAAAWGTAFARFSLIAHDRIVMIEVEAGVGRKFLPR